MSENEQLQERIDELEKELAEMRESLKLIAFELQTPLVPMKGFIRTLLDDANEEWYLKEDRREFYTIIDENIDRLRRILKEGAPTLPPHNRSELNWQNDVDVREILEKETTRQRQRTDKHQIVLEIEPERILIEADPDQFAIIFYRIVENAIKYATAGGEIKITVCVEPPSKTAPDGTLMIQVYQPGIGLDKAQLKSVGTAFIKPKPQPNVHGLGIVSPRTLIEWHGGTMEWDSEGVDKGMTTIVRIPVRQTEETKATRSKSDHVKYRR